MRCVSTHSHSQAARTTAGGRGHPAQTSKPFRRGSRGQQDFRTRPASRSDFDHEEPSSVEATDSDRAQSAHPELWRGSYPRRLIRRGAITIANIVIVRLSGFVACARQGRSSSIIDSTTGKPSFKAFVPSGIDPPSSATLYFTSAYSRHLITRHEAVNRAGYAAARRLLRSPRSRPRGRARILFREVSAITVQTVEGRWGQNLGPP